MKPSSCCSLRSFRFTTTEIASPSSTALLTTARLKSTTRELVVTQVCASYALRVDTAEAVPMINASDSAAVKRRRNNELILFAANIENILPDTRHVQAHACDRY